MATMAAACESPTNRTPSGPKAIGPADFSWALPACMLAVEAPKARNAAQQRPAAKWNSEDESFTVTVPSSRELAQCYHSQRRRKQQECYRFQSTNAGRESEFTDTICNRFASDAFIPPIGPSKREMTSL